MAKEQNLSLNQTKISGVCGRLMCCLKNRCVSETEAKQRSYENLENILDSIQKTKVRLKANVNFDLAFELSLIHI